MLDPSLIGQALVSTLQNIPTLLTVLNNNAVTPGTVKLHAFEYGLDFRLTSSTLAPESPHRALERITRADTCREPHTPRHRPVS